MWKWQAHLFHHYGCTNKFQSRRPIHNTSNIPRKKHSTRRRGQTYDRSWCQGIFIHVYHYSPSICQRTVSSPRVRCEEREGILTEDERGKLVQLRTEHTDPYESAQYPISNIQYPINTLFLDSLKTCKSRRKGQGLECRLTSPRYMLQEQTCQGTSINPCFRPLHNPINMYSCLERFW